MNDTPVLLPAIVIALGAVAGGVMLRRAWRARAEPRLGWIVGGWLLIALSVVWPGWVLGGARGPFVAVTLVSLAVLALVATGLTQKTAKGRKADPSLAPEPLERPSTVWRTTLRWLLAGPIGMVAAMAVGIAYSVWVPGAAQTRLLIGGLIVPVVWGGAMAWTLADNRILRATAVLVAVSVAGFGLSILKGFA